MRKFVGFIWLMVLIWGCARLPVFTYPDPFDTSDKAINYQEKKVFDSDPAVFADNLFDGARLNGFDRMNDSSFVVTIQPENEPINPSPWYAFRVWSKKAQTIHLYFDYGKYKHRYYPKVSSNGQLWADMDSARVINDSIGVFQYLKIPLSQDTIWIAGQEVVASREVKTWTEELAEQEGVEFRSFGKSRQDRDMIALDIDRNPKARNPVLVVLSRQHPPEVTGYRAMQFFVEELLSGDSLSEVFLNKARVLVLPLMNPDGVDLGHWRHGAGGVDLNRDWAVYQQPEVRQAVDFINHETRKRKVIMGIDFHSTYHDVFYTNDTLSTRPYMKSDWFEFMESQIEDYEVNERPSAITRPVSKSWFFSMFGVEGVTYEVGDDTPEELIELKGRVSARSVMRAFLSEN